MKITTLNILLFILIFFTNSCKKEDEVRVNCSTESIEWGEKITGASILQKWKLQDFTGSAPNHSSLVNLVEKTNSDWVSLSPVIGISNGVNGSNSYSFWISAEVAKMEQKLPRISNSGLNNVMLKPLTSFESINGSSYWGDFYVETEEEWVKIENAFEELIYEFAKLSLDFEEIKLLSIGNELSEFSKRRPDFFKHLIKRLKDDFPLLKLTYSSNWDEYNDIVFWEDLDYIGVNSYFPLVEETTPEVSTIEHNLLPIKENLFELSCRYEKPILFTEYGYRSIDFALWKSWDLGMINQENLNFEAQKNGYSAFYNTFWNEDWIAGGFFWEWKVVSENGLNDPNENGWYVNDKPVEKIIMNWYEK